MLLYHYAKNTYEFTHITEARVDPLEPHKYLIPSYSTLIETPTKINDSDVFIFDIDQNNWILKNKEPIKIFFVIDCENYLKLISVISCYNKKTKKTFDFLYSNGTRKSLTYKQCRKKLKQIIGGKHGSIC